MSRREQAWKPGPVVVSLLMHGAVVGALALAAPGEAEKGPREKVYAVDIVSPPPNVLGPPMTEARTNQEPGPAAQPAPSAETPAAEPPAPDPEPAPPPREAPKEPQKAPEPRRTPPAERPAQPTRPPTPARRPPTTNNRPTTPSSSATRPAPTPEKGRTSPTPEKGRQATDRPAGGSSTTSGTGTGTNRTRGNGTSTAPATGTNPQPNAAGGEGITIRNSGEACPVAGYCDNVTRQVRRFFRPPANSAGARGDLCFRIMRDGSVTDIRVERASGGAAFRLQMMEAAEAAGNRRAFGTLPTAFADGSRWCVTLTPS